MGTTDIEKVELGSYKLKDVILPREMKEAKVEEFINLKQGSMTVRDYSLKFVKLSRYATSLVSNSRDEMSKFLTRISGNLEEKCRAAMLHDGMDLSRLMVLVIVAAGTTSAAVSSPDSKRGIRVQGTLTLRGVQHLEKVDPSPRRAMEVICCVQEGNVPKCGRTHSGQCRQNTNARFSCGKSGHMVKDYP
ncbi:uncharacterized protein [Solanum lycopersicum]|uniref:uncharacterized protein n=1 Tax=Solanum lycopersicum TaxID=4081 RepID=UPI0037484A28